MEGLVVEVGAGGDAARAQELAVRLGVPVGTSAAVGGLCLLVGEKGLSLEGDGMSLAADLSRMVPRLRAGNLNRELVVRAARIRGAAGPLTAVDATAGMGEDSLLLAAAGFSVTIFWKLIGLPFGIGATVPGAIACALALVLVSLATYKKAPTPFLNPYAKQKAE